MPEDYRQAITKDKEDIISQFDFYQSLNQSCPGESFPVHARKQAVSLYGLMQRALGRVEYFLSNFGKFDEELRSWKDILISRSKILSQNLENVVDDLALAMKTAVHVIPTGAEIELTDPTGT